MAENQPKLDVVGDVEWPGGVNPFEYEGDQVEDTPPAAETPDQAGTVAETEQPEAQPDQQQPEATPEPEAPAQPTEPAAPGSDSAPSDEEQKPEAADPAAEPEVEVPENDPYASLRDDKGLILGKYKTVDDWAAGHRQAEGWATQQAQARAEAEREAAQAREILTQLQPYMPLIQQAMQGQVPQVPAQQQQPQPPAVPDDIDLSDPQQLTTFLAQRDAQIRQEMQVDLQQQMQQQWEAQQQHTTQQQAVSSQMEAVHRFRSRVEDAAPGTPIDMGIAQVFDQYRKQGVEEFGAYSEENLEVAYTLVKNPRIKEVIDRFELVPDRDAIARVSEIVADPNLARFVAANPAALTETDDEGWEAAKSYAALPALLQGAQNGAQANVQQQQQQARTMAHLEAGRSGAPVQAAPGEQPKSDSDVFLETVVKPWREQTSAFLPRGTS